MTARAYGRTAWTLLGCCGSVLLTLAGSRLGGGRVSWWFHPRLLGGGDAQRILFYLGIAALVLAWLGLGRSARTRAVAPRQLTFIAALWCLPLLLGAPLFSRDLYSYMAQGTIAHVGLNPYHVAPTVLGRAGHAHVLHAVDPFWRHTTAPYGPVFVGIISLIAGATGSHLVLGVSLVRGLGVIGFVLLAWFVPRLARSLGSDPTRALWLTVASPLVLLQLVAPGHNDLLMAGVMVAGISLALERRWLLGVALCALAATIKLPALAGVLFIAVAWSREQPVWRDRLARAGATAGIAIAVMAAVTLVTGFGPSWFSSALFSTPAKVKLAITPATDVSWTAAKLLGDLGISVSFTAIQSVLRVVALVASVMLSLVLLFRVRRETLAPHLGLALIAFAVGGPALWPWYLAWGLVLLAAWLPVQRSRLVVAGIVVAALVVKPDGILALSRGSSPIVVCLWLALAGLLFWDWRRRERRPGGGLASGLGSGRSALAERSA